MKKIVIIEDDKILREELEILLNDSGYQAEILSDFTDAAAQVRQIRPDLVLLDIILPGANGQYILRQIREKSDVPVIMLTSKDGEVEEIMSRSSGADDYVTKPFNPVELQARVKSQLRRYTQLGNVSESYETVYQVGGLMINDDLKEVTVDGELVKLTPIEYNILLLLVKNQGKVFSIEQIYENIWNEEAIGADNTVAVHIRHIREKIEINPKEPRYLKVVWGVGYKVEKIG